VSQPVPGAYEHLVTDALDQDLRTVSAELVSRRPLDPADADETLARHIAALTRRALRSVGGATDIEVIARQVEMANQIAGAIAARAPSAVSVADLVAASENLLLAIARPPLPPAKPTFPIRPAVPLSASALLVNDRGQPGIGSEIIRELASADRVDMVCAFIKWYGLRLIEEPIRELIAGGGRLRVLTSTYLGSTERRAIDRLVELGAQVKVSFDGRTTRLHAKAWLFRRDTGLDTAYVGSSNLSRTALIDGLEWNVRLSAAEQPHLIDTFGATFEDYWNDPTFEEYEPGRDGDRLDNALAQERGGPTELPLEIATLDVRPWGYQAQVLDELDAERMVHNRWRSLVVMATGTGKTVVAALDYKRLRTAGKVESLLFVAHREEILRQSQAMFRQVLRDGTFGELYVGGAVPEQWRHVFASIQSLNRTVSELDPSRYRMIIVDEFHHAEAATYTRLLDHLRPTVLLGLTATPDRADGRDVTRWFGGRIASELRLWEALERQLLAPFHYFGINDEVALDGLQWRRGRGYDELELSNVYTGNDVRVRLILAALREKVPDVRTMRAVGFCVSIAHARFMAERFTAAGVPSLAVTAESSPVERRDGRLALEKGTVKVLFTVDLFNEGVDIPAIDTILFLRPTESATVFLQQLGRGLRLADGKSCATVLDFVGSQHAEFRFDLRYRALTGVSRRRLATEVEEGFPTLPSGCHISLDRVVSQRVLENVRRSLRLNWNGLATELGRLGPSATLPQFLDEVGLDLPDLYRPGRGGWASVRRLAGLDSRPVVDGDETLGKAIGRILHIDDPERLRHLRSVLAAGASLPPASNARESRLQEMLRLALYGAVKDAPPASDQLRSLAVHPARGEELSALTSLLEERIRRVTQPVAPAGSVPLHVHGRYSRDEALAAFGDHDAARYMREGARWVEAEQSDLFFVTLNKTEAHFSPTTMYADRAISPVLFQWETQSTTTEASATGQRYIHHATRGSTVHLFLRDTKVQDGALGAPPYFYAGTMSYVEHRGERPMRFIWRLSTPLPADIFHLARTSAA
jgi:superfamily II DNA or RNA helicase